MKITKTINLVEKGEFAKSDVWTRAKKDVAEAVKCIDWPHGSGKFQIKPESKGNGVVPIKVPCINNLQALGWHSEKMPEGTKENGAFDLLTKSEGNYIGFEWETGNVSSSYRSIDKTMDFLRMGLISGAFMVVPSKDLARYLTDRIGNWEELAKRLDYWQAIGKALVKNGTFQILVIEHDITSSTADIIPKGKDGNAFRASDIVTLK